jgi:hypothetical protein
MPKQTPDTKDAEADLKKYQELGRLLVAIGESGEVNTKKLYKTAFIKGIYSGLGGVIGATIVLAMLLYVISLLGQIPFLDTIAESVEQTIENR